MQALQARHSENPLLQCRGQPSTHDVNLATTVLGALYNHNPIRIPVYDKSAFGGAGDRLDIESWDEVNTGMGMVVDPNIGPENRHRIAIVLFEGWCLGYRALDELELEKMWNNADPDEIGLGGNSIDHLRAINEALKS